MAEKPVSENFFVITSGGRAATYWLSHLLNLSPDVFCMHGYFPASKLAEGEKNAPDDFGRSGYEIEDIHNLDGSSRSWNEWNKILEEQWDAFNDFSIDAYFAELKSVHRLRIYGNVHGYTYDSFIRKMKENPPEFNIQYCNLTRHPVARVQSFFTRFSHTEKWNPESLELIATRKSNARNLRDGVLSRFSIDIYDDDKWLFPDSIIRMIFQYGEATLENFPQVRSEEITSDKDKFKQLFDTLTEGRVELTEKMLDDKNFSRRLNRTLNKTISPAKQFFEWEPWKQFIFKNLIRPNWLKAYEKIGYEISFIDKDN